MSDSCFITRHKERARFRNRIKLSEKDKLKRFLKKSKRLNGQIVTNPIGSPFDTKSMKSFEKRLIDNSSFYELKSKVTEQIMNEYDEYGFKYSVGYTKYNKQKYEEVDDM